MKTCNALDSRLRALEDEFFRQVDIKLCEQLREQILREGKREKLTKLVSIEDQSILDELIDYGINDETVAVLLLVPLVFVAWADGHVTDAERQTVIEIVMRYSPGDRKAYLCVIEQWLDRKPSEKLWDAWKAYVQAVRKRSSGTVAAILSEKLLEHAGRVAKASTSYLNLKRIAIEKQQALARLREALDD
ncbi:hypothetical protein [Novipirellula artificiosorum]|nr:hypothetical protein [Novipirellula artificiosorum]